MTFPSPIERKSAQIAGVETTYLDVGDGPAIVALHGIPTSSALFEPLIPHLPGFRFIAPDLLGQGGTRVPPAGSLGHRAYGKHAQEFLEVIPPRSFHLMVHDLGGLLGLAWAIVRPERVESLIILSTAGAWTWRCALRNAGLQALTLIGGRAALRRALVRRSNRPGALPAPLAREWIRPWSRRRILRGIDHFGHDHLRLVAEHLGSLRLPTLLAWGTKDRVFPLRHAEHIRAALPHARLVRIPDAGHLTPLDAPESLAREVVSFVRSLPR